MCLYDVVHTVRFILQRLDCGYPGISDYDCTGKVSIIVG